MSLSDTALVDLIQTKNYLRIDATSSLVVEAEYVGMGDAETVEFTLDNAVVSGSLRLYVDGALQVEDTDFSISDTTITFTEAPGAVPITASYDYAASDDTFESYDDDLLENLIASATQKAEDYCGRAFIQRSIVEKHQGDGTSIMRLYKRPISSLTSVTVYHAEYIATGDGSTKVFTLDYIPIDTIDLYVNGVLQTLTEDYTISSKTITFGTAPGNKTRVSANYNEALSTYYERLSIGRLCRDAGWGDYFYEVTYTAGYASTRAATQALVPNAVNAVLLMVAYLFENRTDQLKNQNISGLGSVTYDIPSQAKELLNFLRVDVL